ncbi:MAG: hypothetical protein WD468_02345 [Pirellulales bacterium]
MSRMLEALKQIEKRAPTRPTRETMRSRPAAPETALASPAPAPATATAPRNEAVLPWPSGVADSAAGAAIVEPVAIVPRQSSATRVIEPYYVHLRDTLLSQAAPQAPLALLFVRVGEVADASVVVAELAVAFASRTPGEVLAIDADLGAADAAEGTLGFRDVLAGRKEWHECMTATATPRVRFLAAGEAPLPGNVKDDTWKNAIARLRSHFAHVLLDGGHVNGEHIQTLSRLCNSTFLLIELGRTTRRSAQAAIRQIRRRGGKLGGCILTGADTNEVVAQLR